MAAKSLCKRQVIKTAKPLEPIDGKKSPLYIVSLTSYGKRLATDAPFAIATLLNQSVKPDRVILWVANEDRGNVPKIMEKLTEKGLEIRYCEDTRSYKKLIPSIENFPNDNIITADDDIFYPQNWLEQLLAEHRKSAGKIICHRAHGIKVDGNHNLLPYDDWVKCIEPNAQQSEMLFPTGVGGILYPFGSLSKDVTNKALFTKLAPYADDIWFWAMAAINKEYFGNENPYIVVENSCTKTLFYVNILQQLSGNALWNYNRSQGGNDKQLTAVINHYPQIKERLKKNHIVLCASTPST